MGILNINDIRVGMELAEDVLNPKLYDEKVVDACCGIFERNDFSFD